MKQEILPLSAALRRAASIDDLRRIASKRLPRMVFDYIDGGSGNESTARRNRRAFDDFQLRAEILSDVSSRDPSTTLFGQQLALPIIIGPTGMNGAYWPDGDLCLARAAKAENIPFVMSTAATTKLGPLAKEAGPLRWFQLYMLRDRSLAIQLLARIHDAGFHVLQLTVDTAVTGRRSRDIRNGFTLPFRWTAGKFFDAIRHPGWAMQMLRCGSPTLQLFAEIVGPMAKANTIAEVVQRQISDSFTWNDLVWLREQWPGKLVIKGISSPTHVSRACDIGLDGVVLSNHGGRQLDGGRSTIEALPEIADRAAGRIALLIDSGFRTGADIAKAIALGADAVQLGRSTLYGLAAAGEIGARHAVQILAAELDCALALCGAASLAQLHGRIHTAGRET